MCYKCSPGEPRGFRSNRGIIMFDDIIRETESATLAIKDKFIRGEVEAEGLEEAIVREASNRIYTLYSKLPDPKIFFTKCGYIFSSKYEEAEEELDINNEAQFKEYISYSVKEIRHGLVLAIASCISQNVPDSLETVKAIVVDSNPDINAEIICDREGDLRSPYPQFRCLLIGAIYHRRIDIITELLKSSALDLNVKDKWGRTPLMIALDANFVEEVALLIADRRVEPTINLLPPKSKFLLFKFAIVTKNETLINRLLSARFQDYINLSDDKGVTLLMHAIKEENQKLAEFLLDCPGADLRVLTQQYYTAFSVALYKRNWALLEKMCKKKEVINHSLTMVWFIKNRSDELYNIFARCITEVELNNSFFTRKDTFLIAAVCDGKNTRLIKLIVDQPSIDVNLQDGDRKTAVHHALTKNKVDALRILIDSGKVNMTLYNEEEKLRIRQMLAPQAAVVEAALPPQMEVVGSNHKRGAEDHEIDPGIDTGGDVVKKSRAL